MADEPKKFTLYAPGSGDEYTTTVPAEAVRLRAAGYSDTKPEAAEKAEDKPEDKAPATSPDKPSRPKPGDTPA